MHPNKLAFSYGVVAALRFKVQVNLHYVGYMEIWMDRSNPDLGNWIYRIRNIKNKQPNIEYIYGYRTKPRQRKQLSGNCTWVLTIFTEFGTYRFCLFSFPKDVPLLLVFKRKLWLAAKLWGRVCDSKFGSNRRQYLMETVQRSRDFLTMWSMELPLVVFEIQVGISNQFALIIVGEFTSFSSSQVPMNHDQIYSKPWLGQFGL